MEQKRRILVFLCLFSFVLLMISAQEFGGRRASQPTKAYIVVGNRHSGEVTAGECAIWIAWHVLSNYGKDPEITHLVDTKALYLKPKNNPDGSELYLGTAQSNWKVKGKLNPGAEAEVSISSTRGGVEKAKVKLG